MKRAPYLLVFLLLAVFSWSSCQKNTVSKIPHIALTYCGPDTIHYKNAADTLWIQFSLVDGDGDIGNSDSSNIYWKDSRYDSGGFNPTPFPPIDGSIEDPNKGLQGSCTFFPIPQPVPRTDSVHMVCDTLYYEVYITDRASHHSNHVFTQPIIIRP